MRERISPRIERDDLHSYSIGKGAPLSINAPFYDIQQTDRLHRIRLIAIDAEDDDFGASRLNHAGTLLERIANYPGRRTLNRKLKDFRRSLLGALPSSASHCDVIWEQPDWDRWADLDASAYPEAAMRSGGDRPTRTGRLREYRGDLVLDPCSNGLFDRKRIIWGSYDGIGREREPSVGSFLRGADIDLGAFVNMRGAFENNYFHFLYDFIPKLFLAEAHVPRGVPLVIGESLVRQPYFREAAAMGLFAGHAFFIQSSPTRIGGRQVWVPSPVEPARDDLLKIAERFGATACADTPGLRLYVARGPKASNKRRLLNEAELFARLGEHRFVFFDPQEHDLETQIATFARAEIVVSPHGAGLTNLIWRAGRSCNVIELVNPSMHTLDMAHISAQLGYQHRIVENVGDAGQPLRSSARADIARVMEALKFALDPAEDLIQNTAS